jgi:DNA-binding XRE family transcriptional regulator
LRVSEASIAIIELMNKKTLKELRKVANLTQNEAAEQVGVSHDTISRWESGITQPTAPQIIDICRAYNCKFDNIIWPDLKQDT